MKKFISVIVLYLLFSSSANSGPKWGKGDLQLSDYVAESFIRYIKGNVSQTPHKFAVSKDGLGYQFYYCSTGSTCSGGDSLILEECSKNSGGTECFIFASRRTIKWKNGTNPGKGNASKFSRKWSDQEIYAKLTELGFYNNSYSNKTDADIETDKEAIYPSSLFFPDKTKIDNWKQFTKYGKDTAWPFTAWAEVIKSPNDDVYDYQWQASKKLNSAINDAIKGCDDRLKKRKNVYKNSQICIVYFINGKETTVNEKIKFAEKFYGKKVSKESFEKNDWIINLSKSGIQEVKKSTDKSNDDFINQVKDLKDLLNSGVITQEEFDIAKKKIKKKKIVKKYELKGERSIALSWDGYDNLIAGTVEFDETDYKGTLNLPLPNNDGICNGSYSLQEGGKGTWQIACTNNMGAAGTLSWTKDGSVTGRGRDHDDKKVKFTVSKKS